MCGCVVVSGGGRVVMFVIDGGVGVVAALGWRVAQPLVLINISACCCDGIMLHIL